MTRKSARDLTFKIIYQADIQKESTDVIYKISTEDRSVDELSEKYILYTLSGIEEHSEEINNIIAEKSKGWKINRISKISLACLKLGIFEVLFNEEVPNPVAINEAVTLAKLYEGEDSAKFVNGILSVII